MEFQAGVGSCQLPVVIGVPAQTGDSSFDIVRISEDTGESSQEQSRNQSRPTATASSYLNTLTVFADGVSSVPSTSSSSSK